MKNLSSFEAFKLNKVQMGAVKAAVVSVMLHIMTLWAEVSI